MDWRDRGACLGADPELFFPVGDGNPAITQIAIAKHVCQRCPVQRACLDWALAAGVEGVWGGTDDAERRLLRRRQLRRRSRQPAA